MLKRLFICLLAAAVLLCTLPSTVLAASTLYGDVDNNGTVDDWDSVTLSRFLANWSNITLEQTNSDVDGDGNINDWDSILLARYLANWDIILGPEEFEITINGAAIENFVIVTPENATLYEQYAAVVLKDHLEDHYGVILNIVSDTQAESNYELLIGNTNRAASKAHSNVSMGEMQYYLCAETSGSDVKIVMLGNNIMVGGATSALVNNYIEANRGNVTIPSGDSAQVETFTFLPAKNAIIMIGDGMGINHVELGEHGFTAGFNMEEEIDGDFVGKYFTAVGECTTLNASGEITDSAAAATALSSGYKTNNYRVGCDVNGTPHQNIFDLAKTQQAKAAIITTDIATGATPSGFTVHVEDRNDTEEIQRQHDLLDLDYFAADVGDELQAKTREALRNISTGDSFYMMVEEGMIDKAADSEDTPSRERAANVGKYVVRLHNCAAYVTEFVLMNPDTILIITADHETGMYGYRYNENIDLHIFYSLDGTSHTNRNVPVYALGAGTEIFDGTTTDNVLIGRFMAAVWGAENFNADVPTTVTEQPAA